MNIIEEIEIRTCIKSMTNDIQIYTASIMFYS